MSIKNLVSSGFLSIVLSPVGSLSASESSIFNCVHFAENGNDIVVDSDCLAQGLDKGADPNWINREKNKIPISTLSRFVRLISISNDPSVVSDGTKAVRTLIEAGAKLQAVDDNILYFPVTQGKTSLVRLLLDLGADPSAWPNDKIGTDRSPVEAAAAAGHEQMVDLLVDNGAKRPTSKVAIQERFVRAATFETKEKLETLIAKGAAINGRSRDNEVALINALFSIGRSDCQALQKIQWLLDKGADPNLHGNGMFVTGPPLHEAIWLTKITHGGENGTVCSEKILQELLEHGAYVAGRDSSGQTPLHIAAERDHIEAARILLEAGSTVMPRDQQGITPLDRAKSSEMIKLLKDHGATER